MVLQQTRCDFDVNGGTLLKTQGCRPVRHFLRMLTKLNRPPPTPRFPPGLTVRTFNRVQALPALVRVEQEVFQYHWGYVERDFN